MPDVFDILLNAKKNRNLQESKKKLKSIISGDESEFYDSGNSSKNVIEEDDEFDFNLGDEKKTNEHISDIKKISMKQLDKKPPKEQLRILKLEYNRLYDRIIYLNDLLVSNERNFEDTLMDKKELENENKQLKGLIRNSVNALPGVPDLKNLINQGKWTPDEVMPLLNSAIEQIVFRQQNFEKELQETTEELRLENLDLKEKLLKYQQIAMKVMELEEKIKNKQGQASNNPDNKEKEVESSKEKNDQYNNEEKNNVEETVKAKEQKEDSPSMHNTHFTEIFTDFEKNYKKQKQKNPTEIVPEFKSEPKKDNKRDSNHPLSPDFVEKEKVPDLFDNNLQSYLNNLSDDQEFILKIIGETGISRNPDLRDYLKEHEKGSKIYMRGRKFDYHLLSADVAELRSKGILDEEKLSLEGMSGGSNIIVYELSDIGKQCYKYLFKDDPVVSEKKRMKDIHASLEHGYLIKDSTKFFKEMGYKVYTDLKDVTEYTGDGNERKVFDFVIENDKGEKMYIEVERGTHNKDDFFNAMDKIYKITKDFYFICPNDKVKNKITKQMFFSWVTERLGGIKNADVVLNMTTINQLKKKPKNIWETTDLRGIK